jgi:hypothetical protein
VSRKEKIQEAIEEFGQEIVNEVIEIVYLSDPDGAYSMFEDMGKYEHAECISMIYFED